MARMPGLVVTGYPHHVTQRGNRRMNSFFYEDEYLVYYHSPSGKHWAPGR